MRYIDKIQVLELHVNFRLPIRQEMFNIFIVIINDTHIEQSIEYRPSLPAMGLDVKYFNITRWSGGTLQSTNTPTFRPMI